MLMKRFYLLPIVALIGIALHTRVQAQCISTFPYQEDFEASAGGWTSAAITLTGIGPNSWVRAIPANPIINSAASGSRCWITGNNPFVLPPLLPYAYAPNEYSAATSPCFDFSTLQNPGIIVKIWWESEFSVDGTVLQSSIDNGVTWQRVGKFGDPIAWYNDNTITGGISGPGGQLHGWTGTLAGGTGSGGWITAQHALNGLAGQPNVRLRFAFAADGGTSSLSLRDGFAFDDVFIGDMPTVSLPNDTILCYQDTVVLNACVPVPATYSWNTNPVLDTFCTKVAVATGTYIVTVKDTIGFIVRDTFNLFVSPTNVLLPPDQLICPGDSVNLNMLNGSASHLWLPDSVQSQFLTVSETGTYTAIASDQYGCVSIDSIRISVDFVPDVNLGNDTAICTGQSLILDAGEGNPGTTYNWSPIVATTQTVFIASPAQYVVVVTSQAGCTATDTINIGVSLAPVVNLGADRVLCDSIVLNAGNPGATYSWFPGNDTTQILTIDQPGLYWVNVVNAVGCRATDTLLVTQGSVPQIDLGADKLLCNDQPVLLDAGLSGMQYFWSTGQTTQTIFASFPGTYFVRVTNAQGCVGRDTVEVDESTLAVDLGADRNICEGEPTLLQSGVQADAYLWSTGDLTPAITISTGGTYSVQVTDSTGCTVADTVVIGSQPDFTADFAVGGVLRLFETVQFTDQSGGTPTSWLWDFGDGFTATQQNPTHQYQSLGDFTVCLTARQGACTNVVCKTVRIDIFESIEDELGLTWGVYPNPNQGSFRIDMALEAPAHLELRLLDLSGRELWQALPGHVVAFDRHIDMQGLARGMYLLEARIDGVAVCRKVRVE
ncbi:MAG: hypothetical protein OHK0039_47550 [Bacteroidia bacterium]